MCSKDGAFNHAVYVSTKQMNSADSAASNIGFRCAGSFRGDSSGDERSSGGVETEREREREGDRAEL